MLLKVGTVDQLDKFQRKGFWREEHVETKIGLWESLRIVTKEFCEESSICGLKRLVDTERSLCERMVWVVVMLVSLACSASLVLLTFQQFNNAPLVTTQLPEGVPVSSIIFPTVSICTTNRMSKQSAAHLADILVTAEKNKSKEHILDLLPTLGRLYDLEINNITRLNELHAMLEDIDITTIIYKLTPNCKDVLLRCMWEGTPRNCSELFDVRLTMNGFCCTFNYMRETDDFDERSGRTIDMYNIGNKSNFGYYMGLRVLLNLTDKDDFYTNAPLYGAQVLLTDAYDFPDAASGSLRLQMVTPERMTTVLLSASVTEASRDIEHVPVELRGCLFHDESSYLPLYTNSDCLLKCRVLFILDKCGCTPFNVPKMAGARTCGLRDVICLHNYTAQSITVQPPGEDTETPEELELDLVGGGIDCGLCYPTCSKIVVAAVAETIWMYPDYLNMVPDTERETWLRGIDFTGLSLFHIKYGDEKANAYEQNIVMKWFDIVSNIGSTCGFVTGFSFVSLLEIFYFFTFRLFRLRSKGVSKGADVGRLRRVRPREVPREEDSKAKDVGTNQSIYWKELGAGIREGNNFTITGTYASHNHGRVNSPVPTTLILPYK